MVVANDFSMAQIEKLKHNIKHELVHLNIHHSTLETETGICAEEVCNEREKHTH